MTTQTRSIKPVLFLSLVTLLIVGTATVVYADDTAEPRINTSSQGKGSQRTSADGSTVTHTEFAPLLTQGTRGKSTRGGEQQKLGSAESGAPNVDFWFYDANVELYSDLDRDGFYAGVDLSFDADTVYDVADVYAVVYVSYELGPWNEFAVTDDFAIFGASGDDEYFIDTELVSGYPTGEYDIMIELFDTFDGSFVASIGPDESAPLSILPLEDIGRDTPVDTVIVVHEGGGGSLGWLTLLALMAAGCVRIRARSH